MKSEHPQITAFNNDVGHWLGAYLSSQGFAFVKAMHRDDYRYGGLTALLYQGPRSALVIFNDRANNDIGVQIGNKGAELGHYPDSRQGTWFYLEQLTPNIQPERYPEIYDKPIGKFATTGECLGVIQKEMQRRLAQAEAALRSHSG